MHRNGFSDCAIRFFVIGGICTGLLLGALPGIPSRTAMAGSETAHVATRHAISLDIENDSFISGDRQYTSGLKMTWSRYGFTQYPKDAYPHKWLYPLVNLVGFGKKPDSKKALSLSVGQSIYTPDDLTATKVVKNDRPYAGITYVEFGFHQQYDTHLDTLELQLGLVGPNSYAKEVQDFVHQSVNGKTPEGWDNQLKDEPVIDIIYEAKKKLARSKAENGFGYDMIFNTGGGIGTVLTYYDLGLSFRTGWNIPDDFGNYPIRPVSSISTSLDAGTGHSKPGVYLFASTNCRLVIRNIFLDGNTFTSSHSVDKNPIVGRFVGGIGFLFGRINTSAAFVYETKEFKTQDRPQHYGAINISYIY